MEVTSTQSSSDAGSFAGSVLSDPALGLGKDAFMKMLLSQIRYQNPLDPVNNTDFIAQLAQFSSLEAMQNLQATMQDQAKVSNLSAGASMIGREIKIQGPEDAFLFGIVDGVEQTGGQVFLRVGETLVKMSQVLEVN
jgi:flagellar basal-body rod modification protein FlgD